MDSTTLGLKLSEARKQAGLTQAVAATRLGITRTAITQIEAGKRSVSALELRELASQYNADITDLLLTRNVPALFRAEKSAKLEAYTHLIQELKDSTTLGDEPSLPPPEYTLKTPENWQTAQLQGSAIARSERQRLNLGASPISSLVQLLRLQGIAVVGENLEDDSVSGIFIKTGNQRLILVVQTMHGLPRVRFSLAHEYAHALLDRGNEAQISSSENRKDFTETRANAFAAAFLIPDAGVHQYLESIGKARRSLEDNVVYDGNDNPEQAPSHSSKSRTSITKSDIEQIASYFGVSYQATTYQLKSLGYITWPRCQEYLSQEDPNSMLFQKEVSPVKEGWERA